MEMENCGAKNGGSNRAGVTSPLPKVFKDADIIGEEMFPVTVTYKENQVHKVGNITFRADFDSANLERVKACNDSKEFEIHTLHDCHGTEQQTNHRSWFYFSVTGHRAGDYFIFNIMNMNKQARLYQNDFRPVFRTFGSMKDWERIRMPCSYQTVEGDFQLRFRHKFDTTEETFFAYCHPHSYEESQAILRRCDDLFAGNDLAPTSRGAALATQTPADDLLAHTGTCSTSTGSGGKGGGSKREAEAAAFSAAKAQIYYRRQMLGLSLEGRRVDVVTITDWGKGTSGAADEQPDGGPGIPQSPRSPASKISGKKVVFVSARVHPGETPGSHLFNGLLAFLLRPTDQRAAALRRSFIFKLVPMLNPDGVALGHYRCDTLGKNLNRSYQSPSKDTEPTIDCVHRLLKHYHDLGSLYFYMDLHAHANKRGVFAYGNALEGDEHITTLTYAKLVSLNNPHFEFEACNFTEKNMQSKDKNGDSKEGSGRVALYQQTGLVHIYTVEANYCCSRIMNQTYPAVEAPDGRVTPPNRLRASPKYSPQLLHGTGRALMIGLLDLEDANPWSRLPQSPYASLAGVRDWVKACLSVKQDASGASSALSSETSFAARGPSPNALPRGASLKKAGDLGGLKPKEVLAEIEKRRRTAASQPKQAPGASSDAPRRRPLPARRSSSNTSSFGRTSEPNKEASRPFRRSNSSTESSSKSQRASLLSEQDSATGSTSSGQRLPPGRGVSNPHAARPTATFSSSDLRSKPPPLDVDVEIDSSKMEELRNFVAGVEGTASSGRGIPKAGRRASLTISSPSETSSAATLPYAMAHDANLVSDALPSAPPPPGGGSSSASSAAALLAASRKQQRERIDGAGRGGPKTTSGEPLMFGTLVQGKSFGRRTSATGDPPAPTVALPQEGASQCEAVLVDELPIRKGRFSASLSPPGRAALIIPSSHIIPVEAE